MSNSHETTATKFTVQHAENDACIIDALAPRDGQGNGSMLQAAPIHEYRRRSFRIRRLRGFIPTDSISNCFCFWQYFRGTKGLDDERMRRHNLCLASSVREGIEEPNKCLSNMGSSRSNRGGWHEKSI